MESTFHGADALEIISPSMRFCVRIEFNEKAPPSDKKYTGSQNTQELMKVLDGNYNKGHAKTEVSVSRKVTGIETESYSSCLNFKNFTIFQIKIQVFVVFL